MLSVLAGISTVVVVGITTYFVSNKKLFISVFSSFLFAVVPYSVFFNRLALADSLLSLFVISSFLLFFLVAKHVRLDLAIFTGFSLGFAWLTKSPAIYAFLLLPLNIVVSQRKFQVLLLFIVSFVLANGMYNVLRLGPEFHMIAQRNLDYVWPLSEIIKHPLDPLIPHLKDTFGFFYFFITPFGLILLFASLFTRHALSHKLILWAWVLIPIVSQSMFAKAFTARYLLFTLPFIVILISQAVSSHRFLKFAGLLLFLNCLLVDMNLLTDPANAGLPRIERSGYLEEWTAGFGIEEMSKYLISQGPKPILLGAEGFFGTPFDGFKVYLNDYPNIRIIGTGLDLASPPQELLNSTIDNEVYWATDNNINSLKPLFDVERVATPGKPSQHLYLYKIER
jgi:hypothetical protein